MSAVTAIPSTPLWETMEDEGIGNTSISANTEELEPMENFTLVTPGVFRSSFPKKKNFSFLKKLKLKSVL
jgi:hypothetical protein